MLFSARNNMKVSGNWFKGKSVFGLRFYWPFELQVSKGVRSSQVLTPTSINSLWWYPPETPNLSFWYNNTMVSVSYSFGCGVCVILHMYRDTSLDTQSSLYNSTLVSKHKTTNRICCTFPFMVVSACLWPSLNTAHTRFISHSTTFFWNWKIYHQKFVCLLSTFLSANWQILFPE